MKNMFLKAYVSCKTAMSNEKGSQALEWIAIAGVVVLLTGLISTAFSGSGLGTKFFTAFSTWIDEIVGN